MNQMALRRNPLASHLDGQSIAWSVIAGMQIAVRFGSAEQEQQSAKSLAICDVSAIPKVGVKGPDATSVLESVGLQVADTYLTARIADEGYCIRLGRDEYFLEGGISDTANQILADILQNDDGQLLCTERQDTAFELTGERIHELFRQICGIDLALISAEQVVMTLVAGVSCCILNRACAEHPAYRVWLDPSYATYLWNTLLGITRELGGDQVGAGVIYPELT